MDLLEHQGKALFRRHGVPVPDGRLWPERPSGPGGYVVKAQVPAGGRGKAGGIGFADDGEAADMLASGLLGREIGDHAVGAILIERRLDIRREDYLAVALDRDRRCLTLVHALGGGVEVESLPPEALTRVAVDPLIGLRDFHVAAVLEAAKVDGETRRAYGAVVRALYRLVVAEEATLAEVNPLALTADGGVVAADAKVVLDDNAAFRRAALPEDGDGQAIGTSALEQAVRATGAVGVEVDPDGDVVAVVSGAGLMMATLDLLVERGHRVRAVVDLGGTVLAGGAVLARVFAAVAAAGPRVTLLNAFMQTALCDEFARMLVQAEEMSPLRGTVVVRLKGRQADEGRRLLDARGFRVHEDLVPALDALADAAGGR
jgi:succinyl-CoA synthetase beta subunit